MAKGKFSFWAWGTRSGSTHYPEAVSADTRDGAARDYALRHQLPHGSEVYIVQCSDVDQFGVNLGVEVVR